MKKLANFLLVGLILIGALVIYDGFYIIEEGKQVMITQLGRPIGKPKTEAGLYFKLPFLQQVNTFDKRIQIWDGDPNQIPTNDKTFVFLDVTARWRIVDALKYMQAVKTEYQAQALLDDIIGGTVRDMINKNNLIEIIRSSDWTIDNMTPSNQEPGTAPERGRDIITDMVKKSIGVIDHGEESLIDDIESIEDRFNKLEIELKDEHLKRLNDKKCSPEFTVMYTDIVHNLEKVGDYCHNIAQMVSMDLSFFKEPY